MTTRIHTLVRTLALAVLAACFFVPTARAQFGLAFTYGDFTEIGGQISLYRPLGIEAAPGLRLGGDIAGYIPQSTEFAGTDISDTYFIESNVNAQYAFLEQGGSEVYGFGGFHYGYSVTTFESDGFDTVTGAMLESTSAWAASTAAV
jgi:hypothetical protein